MLKIAATGATGKMGSVVIAEISKAEDLELQQDITKADILIDFSLPEGTLFYLEKCLEHNVPMVIATTGFTKEQLDRITQASKKIPILMSPNMSIGINILLFMLEKVANLLAPTTMINITDIHHQYKIDSPSGTALKIKDVIKHAAPQLTNNIRCHSERVGEVMGEHKILLTLDHETLEITHKSLSRNIFAKGAIKAARWLCGKSTGFYSMQDLL